MNIQQVLERLKGTTEIGISRVVRDMLFENIKNAHLATPALIEVFNRVDNIDIKIDCLAVLGKIATKDSLAFVVEQTRSNEPHLLYGAALGLANAGRLREASEIYYKLLDSSDVQSIQYMQCFAEYFKPTARVGCALEATTPSSFLVESETPSDFVFDEGAWLTQVALPNTGKVDVVEVRFFNSTSVDGPDEKQLATLGLIQSILTSRWSQMFSDVSEWVKSELMHGEDPESSPGELVVSGIAIPRQWETLEGAFAVEVHSEWEPEHGLEVFVLPDGRVSISINERIASRLYWNNIL